MSLFSKLFGGGGSEQKPAAEPIKYKGFAITPTPIKEGAEYRICALIEKEVAGEVKTHKLVRADTMGGLETTSDASVNKAKVLIDQMGDGLFT